MGHKLLFLNLLFLLLLVTLVGIAQDSSLISVLLLGAISNVNVSVTATGREYIIISKLNSPQNPSIPSHLLPSDTVNANGLLLEGTVIILVSPGNRSILVLLAVLPQDLRHRLLLAAIVVIVVPGRGTDLLLTLPVLGLFVLLLLFTVRRRRGWSVSDLLLCGLNV